MLENVEEKSRKSSSRTSMKCLSKLLSKSIDDFGKRLEFRRKAGNSSETTIALLSSHSEHSIDLFSGLWRKDQISRIDAGVNPVKTKSEFRESQNFSMRFSPSAPGSLSFPRITQCAMAKTVLGLF